MRYAGLAVVALALIVLAPGSPAVPEDGSGSTVVVKKSGSPAGRDVWEARVVLLTPTQHAADGLDLRIRHVLGGEDPATGGRFLTVTEEADPEVLVANLGKLGAVEILDRANLPMTGTDPAQYVNSARIPAPQTEIRSQEGQQSLYVRTTFLDIGTKLLLEEREAAVHASIEASFVLAITGPYGNPVIGHAAWNTSLDLPAGRTAVLRSHYRISAPLLDQTTLPGLPGNVKVNGGDVGRVLIVLLTRSRLP